MKTVRYRLHDKVFALRADAAALQATMVEALRYKGAAPAGEAAADLDMQYVQARTIPELPAEATLITRSPEGLSVAHVEDTYYVAHADALLVIDAPGGTASAHVGASLFTEAQALVRFYLVTIGVVILLRYQERYGLHTAALVRDGAGVLLVAQSGSGKSTTTLNLVRAGWQHLSDDTVLLRRLPEAVAGDRVEALSFRHDFCIKHEMVAQFPALGAHAWPPSMSDPAKWRVDPDVLYPGQFVPRCRPRLVLLPEIVDAATSRLEPIRSATVLQHLSTQAGALLTPRPHIVQKHLRLLSDLMQQVTCLRFLAGRDALTDPEASATLIGNALQEAQQGA